MKVIFVRHGETGENVAHRHQPEDTPLSIRGREQAKAAGQLLNKASVTHVISSPLVRALQTASVIAEQVDVIPSIDHDVQELARPRHLTGRPHFSVRSLLFYKFWFLGISQGGESYKDVRERIRSARTSLQALPEESVVVVVSHTVFINLFVAHLHRDRSLWPWHAAWIFLKIVRMKNTGMIEMAYEEGRWHRTSNLHLL